MSEAKARRVQAPDVRRAQILDGAKQRFRETGFHLTKMADIAASAGVSVGLLYRYFSSKEEVIHAIVEDDVLTQLGAVEAALEAHADDAAALDAVLAELARLVLDQRRVALMLEIAAELLRSPTLAEMAQGVERRMFARLRQRFAAAIPPDEFDTRMRIVLNMFSALGLNVYREPAGRDLGLKLTTAAAREMLSLPPKG